MAHGAGWQRVPVNDLDLRHEGSGSAGWVSQKRFAGRREIVPAEGRPPMQSQVARTCRSFSPRCGAIRYWAFR
jgi:hypothetical protein